MIGIITVNNDYKYFQVFECNSMKKEKKKGKKKDRDILREYGRWKGKMKISWENTGDKKEKYQNEN